MFEKSTIVVSEVKLANLIAVSKNFNRILFSHHTSFSALIKYIHFMAIVQYGISITIFFHIVGLYTGFYSIVMFEHDRFLGIYDLLSIVPFEMHIV